MDRRLRELGAVVVLGMIMSILDTTIVVVAVDTLGRDFKTSLSSIQWVTTGYLLSLSLVIPLTRWTVERFGAKRMWMVSLTLFLAGSVLCGLAWSSASLILFRVVQGFGGGMIMPIGMAILAAEAGPRRIGRVMSLVGLPALVAPVLGPVIGGLIVTHLSWRWIFYVNVPVGVVALVLAARLLHSDDEKRVTSRLDLLGFALISPGLAALVYSLAEAGNGGGISNPKVIVSFVIGVVLTVSFGLHAWRTQAPLLDVRLFRNRTFTVATLCSFAVGAVLFGAMFVLPLYYQVVRGQSALAAGLLMAPQGLGAMIGMPISGRIVDKSGAGRVVPIGFVIVIIGTLAYTQVGVDTNEALLAGALFIRGIGMGFTMMPAIAAAYATLSSDAIPRATTMVNIVQRVGGSFGTALFAVVLQRQIVANVPGSGGHVLSSAAVRTSDSARQALADAFGHTFWWVVGATVVGIVPALFLPRHAATAPDEEQAKQREPVASRAGGPDGI
ncbi:MAG: MDR family MFS transporter [Actinomycetes bacterium]